MALPTSIILVFVIAGLTMVASECSIDSKDKMYSLEWKHMISDVVAHGVVISVQPGSDLSKKSYSVLFSLRCIYKGAPLNEELRIIKVGDNPDNCITSNLTEGAAYVIYLKKTTDGDYYQEFVPDPLDPQNLEEMVVLCDVIVSYPNGYDKDNNKEECPEKYMDDDCISRPDPTNPLYSENNGEKTDTVDATEQEQKGGQEGDKNVPDKVVKSSVQDEANDDNGGSNLTWRISSLICLLLAMILPL